MVLRHGDQPASVGRGVERTINGRLSHFPYAFRAPDSQLAGAAVIVQRFVGRASEQVLIGADGFLLSQHLLDHGRSGQGLDRGLAVIRRHRLEEDVLVIQEMERRAEDRIDALGCQFPGTRFGCRRIHPPKFHAIREGKGESHVAAAGRPGDELYLGVGGQALDRHGPAGGHVQQFQALEIVLARFAEVERIHAKTADAGFARSQFSNGDLPALAIAHHRFRKVVGKIVGRERTGHRQRLDLRSGVAETIRQGGETAGQQKGRRQGKDSLHKSIELFLQM